MNAVGEFGKGSAGPVKAPRLRSLRAVQSATSEAVCCHQTQISIYEQLAHLADQQQRALWGSQEFCRAYSRVNGGRRCETDLLEGLR